MGRVAVVTGGSRGIGAAISKALQAAGYKVAANYAGNDEAAAKFKAETGIPVYKWDVSNYEACVAGLKQVEADLGPVEVLVNNAGFSSHPTFARTTPDSWQHEVNGNLNSAYYCAHAVLEGMKANRGGSIVAIGSVNGLGALGDPAYSAAKAGMISLTKSIAVEYGRFNIRSNIVLPGTVRTPL